MEEKKRRKAADSASFKRSALHPRMATVVAPKTFFDHNIPNSFDIKQSVINDNQPTSVCIGTII